MRMRATALLLGASALMGALGHSADLRAQERIRGVVREVVITHCDLATRGGCGGSLTLEPRAGRADPIELEVPVGTPISHGSRSLRLHEIEGRAVILTQSLRRGERFARAIEVDEPEPDEAAAGH
ncbi:MAG: hypothetical protein ACT4P3_07250 [Betaproteobacteria bacterium]